MDITTETLHILRSGSALQFGRAFNQLCRNNTYHRSKRKSSISVPRSFEFNTRLAHVGSTPQSSQISRCKVMCPKLLKEDEFYSNAYLLAKRYLQHLCAAHRRSASHPIVGHTSCASISIGANYVCVHHSSCCFCKVLSVAPRSTSRSHDYLSFS